MIQIYGSPRSSAGRCFLLLEELGLPYQHMPLDMSKKEHKSPDFLKLNPNGKVPCLVDDGFVIWESLAINSYLAEKHRPELLGKTPQEKGLIQQWSLWALLELQAPMVDILIQMFFVPEERRDQAHIAKSREKIGPALTILDKALAHKKYLVGERLTLADINMASVVNIAPSLQIPLEGHANVLSWYGAMKDRPAFQKFVEGRK